MSVAVDVGAVLVGVASVVAAINAWKAKQYARSADNAVNNVPKGHPTLIQRVGDLEASQHWTASCVCRIARNVGIEIDDPPTQNRRTS